MYRNTRFSELITGLPRGSFQKIVNQECSDKHGKGFGSWDQLIAMVYAQVSGSHMYIGEASKKTGLSIKAIRFYEEKGLIRRPERVGRYRVYQETDLELLILIKEAKELGVSLSQIKGVIIYNNGKVDWANIKIFLGEIRVHLIKQIDDIKKKIDSLDKCYDQINP